jgi:hypothetical protein
MIIKHWFETKEITYYRRYVDDNIIIFDKDRIDIDTINSYMNQIHQHLQFIPTIEENNKITYLDLSIHKNTHNLHIGIRRKPTQTDTTDNRKGTQSVP